MSKRKLCDFEDEVEREKQFLDDIGQKHQHTLDSDESDNENEE